MAVCYWVALERGLLGVFGGHEILVAIGHWESITGLEVSEPIGVGVGGSACFSIEIVFEYVGDLANGAMSVDIRIGWIKIDPDLVAW